MRTVCNLCPLTLELLAIGQVNQSVMRGDPQKLLAALLLPSCGLEVEVLPANACRYLKLLGGARQHRAQVSRHRHRGKQ